MINLRWPPSPVAYPSCIVVCLLISEPNLQGLLLLSVGTSDNRELVRLLYSEDGVTNYVAIGVGIFQRRFKVCCL